MANYGQLWPIMANFSQFWPILAQNLAHLYTCVGSSNLIYALTMVIILRNILWVKVLGFYFQNWLFGPDLAQTWPKFGPIFVHLTHFVTGVGSSNLIYALTVVITFRNILWPKVSSLYFQSWLFWVDLAQVWPKSGPIWSIQKLVRTGIMSVVLWECSWLSKICSDSKSRVSDVKNSRNIFTLFLPQ